MNQRLFEFRIGKTISQAYLSSDVCMSVEILSFTKQTNR